MLSFSGGYPSQGGVILNANTGSDLDANQQAKGVSDFDDDKQKASGHKSEAMVADYDRKITEIESTS